MNEQMRRIARAEGIVVVEHDVATTYSDDRVPFAYGMTHNIAAASGCSLCQSVQRGMSALASTAPATELD